MAKKQADKNIEEIKKLLKAKKTIIGLKVTLKELGQGNVTKVFLAGNSSKAAVDDIEHACRLTGATVVKLDYPNSELGALCKKPFSISVIGVRK